MQPKIFTTAFGAAIIHFKIRCYLTCYHHICAFYTVYEAKAKANANACLTTFK